MNRKMTPDFERRDDRNLSSMVRPIDVSADDEREFQAAMEQYKDRSGRQFPTWSEVFEVLRSLGYAKRIWRPVGAWAPLPSNFDDEGQWSPTGWYSSAETSIMP